MGKAERAHHCEWKREMVGTAREVRAFAHPTAPSKLSIQPEHAIHGAQLGWLDQLGMRDRHRISGPSSFSVQNARKSFSAGNFGNMS